MNALRVTEQMAVYEAQVFLSRDDTQPLVAFTASCTKDDAPNGRYIETAQWAAVNEALTDASYGLQFADVTMRPEDRRYGSEVSLDAAQKLAANAAVEKEKPVQAQPAPVQTAPAQAAPTQPPKPVVAASVQKAQPAQTVPVAQKQQSAAAQPTNPIPMPQVETAKAPAKEPEPAKETTPKPVPQPATEETEKQPIAPVQPALALAAPQAMSETPTVVNKENAQTKAEIQPTAKAPAYAPETPVDEILKSLTLEQAMDVKVDSGLCNGWTMREVAEKRPVSLRFYVFGAYKGKNNLVRAAAKLVLDSLEQKKVG